MRSLLESSVMQGNRRVGPQTKLVGVIDFPFGSRATFGQFLDFSESQVPRLYKWHNKPHLCFLGGSHELALMVTSYQPQQPIRTIGELL